MSTHQTTLTKRCGPDGCTGDCRSGRDCLDALLVTRRILGLRTDNGGERVSGDDSMRIHADEPITTPDQAAGWVQIAAYAALCIVALAAALSPLCFS